MAFDGIFHALNQYIGDAFMIFKTRALTTNLILSFGALLFTQSGYCQFTISGIEHGIDAVAVPASRLAYVGKYPKETIRSIIRKRASQICKNKGYDDAVFDSITTEDYIFDPDDEENSTLYQKENDENEDRDDLVSRTPFYVQATKSYQILSDSSHQRMYLALTGLAGGLWLTESSWTLHPVVAAATISFISMYKAYSDLNSIAPYLEIRPDHPLGKKVEFEEEPLVNNLKFRSLSCMISNETLHKDPVLNYLHQNLDPNQFKKLLSKPEFAKAKGAPDFLKALEKMKELTPEKNLFDLANELATNIATRGVTAMTVPNHVSFQKLDLNISTRKVGLLHHLHEILDPDQFKKLISDPEFIKALSNPEFIKIINVPHSMKALAAMKKWIPETTFLDLANKLAINAEIRKETSIALPTLTSDTDVFHHELLSGAMDIVSPNCVQSHVMGRLEKWVRSFEPLFEAASKANSDQSELTCDICWNDGISRGPGLCECLTFCKACAQKHLEVALQDGQIPRCSGKLKSKCGQLAYASFYEKSGCDPKMIEEFKKHTTLYQCKAIQGFKVCPSNNCHNGRVVYEGPGNKAPFLCSACGFNGCLNCEKNHQTEKCSGLDKGTLALLRKGAMKPPKPPIDDEAHPDYPIGRYRDCPTCGKIICRTHGCNGVKCRECNNQEFDWNTGKLIYSEEEHNFKRAKKQYKTHPNAHF